MLRALRYVVVLSSSVAISVLFGSSPRSAMAGPFSPAAGQPGSTAIPLADPSIVGWATSVVDIVRGPVDISNPAAGLASHGAATDALGATSSVVSLGDGGSITLGFDRPIYDGPGPDLAVFENGFAVGSGYYLELAFVEVSSDGVNFFRFDAVSLTPTDAQVGGFGALDPTNLDNLAGSFVAGYGTPFDLAELADRSPLLNVDDVRYVRLVDVVGAIDPAYAAYDSLNVAVNDPWPTPYTSSGFDLPAVAAMHQVPEPATAALAFGVGFAVIMRSVRRLRRRIHS